MLVTPPYHFSIVASPSIAATQQPSTPETSRQILYRGAIPASRNLPFLRHLRLRTVLYFSKKELVEEDAFNIWARRRNVRLIWLKASSMSEEKLGVGRTEVGEALKVGWSSFLLLTEANIPR
jgi:hypothetical protein